MPGAEKPSYANHCLYSCTFFSFNLSDMFCHVNWYLIHLVDLMAKVNASPKKKVQAKLNTSGKLMSPPADPSVNAPRKFSGFTGETMNPLKDSFLFTLKLGEEKR